MNWKRIVLLVLLFIGNFRTFAQEAKDSTYNTQMDTNAVFMESSNPKLHSNTNAEDSIKVLPFQPNPKKSALFSAILPGSGQLYNRQYWKVPVVYAGLAVATYFLIDNSTHYQTYRRAYISRINNPTFQDEFTGIRTMSDLQVLQNYYKKYLDMTVLFTTIGYTLQVLDALTFAHLKNFDISKNISMKIKPMELPDGNPGFGLVMNWK